ncbi:hypothetical protein BD779DRAFT_1610576 [Infundibulicybe gibba]|nr:hypothetical protein BD779DRAFT_1610576 [Infundibulicybe gibba]
MSVAIQIHPLSNTLDMYGEPDPSSAYSLSGHVTISVTSSYSLFERRRTARLLLQSVALTFEGQSEIITPTVGYSALRLCSITRELAPGDPVELNNEGHEDSDEPCCWNIVFNLPVPGWLPVSSDFGTEDAGTRYSLYATATFIVLDDLQSTSWSFTALCSPFRNRVKIIDAQKVITLKRFIRHPTHEIQIPPVVTYFVNSPTPSERTPCGKQRIPSEVLSKIQVLASVPEYINVDEDVVPITLRLRTKDLEESECKRLQISAFGVDVIQQEKCRAIPSSSYLARYPVPPSIHQPPHEPLRDAHPIASIYDMGLYVSPGRSNSNARSFSLLPPEETGKYTLSGDNYVFANDAAPIETPTWYTLEAAIPITHCSTIRDKSSDWAGPPVKRPTSSGPLFGIGHELAISLTCTYDIPSSRETASERLSFTVPLRFAEVAPPPPPPRGITPPPSHDPALVSEALSSSPSLPLLIPYAQSLPAYSSLYDSNGDRKIDYSIPLPLYTPKITSTPAGNNSALEQPSDYERKDCHTVTLHNDPTSTSSQ